VEGLGQLLRVVDPSQAEVLSSRSTHLRRRKSTRKFLYFYFSSSICQKLHFLKISFLFCVVDTLFRQFGRFVVDVTTKLGSTFFALCSQVRCTRFHTIFLCIAPPLFHHCLASLSLSLSRSFVASLSPSSSLSHSFSFFGSISR